jgi:class 3 adenylate cyclase
VKLVPTAAVRKVAAGIRGSTLVMLEGDASFPWVNPQQILKPVMEFLGGGVPTEEREPKVPAAMAAQAGGLRTVLFTDLVGHTDMMSRLGDERGRAVLREHERITREVLAAHGGTEVKTMGDGFMASFGSVTKAVECAVALQRAFEQGSIEQESMEAGERLAVRCGLNAGEPIEEDGDLFGATVILASRIAAKAGGGEILVADTVRGLCSGKGFMFADLGEFVAKGFEEAVRVYEVKWRDAAND